MNHNAWGRTAIRWIPGLLVTSLLVAVAVIATAPNLVLMASSSSTSASVANLDPALRTALRRATADALADGVELHVNSGWRSPAHQDRLLREAVARYGSKAEAARWVATAETSPHVSGDAVDVGHSDATSWLSEYGAAYGLCQIYRNEPWHFELRPVAVGHGCPPEYADPTQDPRMQQ